MPPHIAVLICCAVLPPADERPAQPGAQWVALFDGESTRGWRAPNGSRWTVASGMMAPQADRPGLLISVEPFRQYELKARYIAPARPAFDPLGQGPQPDDAPPTLRLGCDADGDLQERRGERLRLPGAVSLPLQSARRDSGWIDLTVKVTQDGNDHMVRWSYEGRDGKGSGRRTRPDRNVGGHIALSGNGVVFKSLAIRPLE